MSDGKDAWAAATNNERLTGKIVIRLNIYEGNKLWRSKKIRLLRWRWSWSFGFDSFLGFSSCLLMNSIGIMVTVE